MAVNVLRETARAFVQAGATAFEFQKIPDVLLLDCELYISRLIRGKKANKIPTKRRKKTPFYKNKPRIKVPPGARYNICAHSGANKNT